MFWKEMVRNAAIAGSIIGLLLWLHFSGQPDTDANNAIISAFLIAFGLVCPAFVIDGVAFLAAKATLAAGATIERANPDNASRDAFFEVRRADARRRSVRWDRREDTRDAARSGLICHVGGSAGHTAPRPMGLTA